MLPETINPISFQINYKKTHSDLCWIGAKYDTDKSSQRKNVTDSRHCHPYTLLYHSLFNHKRNEELLIAEVGILNGASLLMWSDYFPKSKIYGFDFDVHLIDSFKNKYNNERLEVGYLNVQNSLSIIEAFCSTGKQFDLIIEDTTHEFEDQLRVIENVHQFLKPGGMLIIEDIFKSYKEKDYVDRLKPILSHFQDFYFVTMDHQNKCSTGWDNDKVLVLVKSGGSPIFSNQKKMTIITPSSRPFNLLKMKTSINFNYVDEWIIVYDGREVIDEPYLFLKEENPKIKEYIHSGEGISGNSQRNFALDRVQNKDTYLYFLDDDNLIHKDLYRLLHIIDDSKIYTFNQKDRIKGSNIRLGKIDTAMFLIDFKLCKQTRWVLHQYTADFYYISENYKKNKDQWVYVNNELCTYNILPR